LRTAQALRRNEPGEIFQLRLNARTRRGGSGFNVFSRVLLALRAPIS